MIERSDVISFFDRCAPDWDAEMIRTTLVNCAYIGIILSISRHVNELKKQQEQEEAEKQKQIQEAAVTLLQNAANLAKEQTLNESQNKEQNGEI